MDDGQTSTQDTGARAAAHQRPWWDRLTPRAGARIQLFLAASVWLVGVGFLLVRGVLFVEVPREDFEFSFLIVPVALVAIVLGIVKARYVLIRYANKAVARIRRRGHACVFGFFSLKSWLFVAVMMGGGIALRHTTLVDTSAGRVALATLYIAVGTALAIADGIFWMAALRPGPGSEARAAGEQTRAAGEPARPDRETTA